MKAPIIPASLSWVKQTSKQERIKEILGRETKSQIVAEIFLLFFLFNVIFFFSHTYCIFKVILDTNISNILAS